MYAGDPDPVRSWTARHGATLRALVAAHADLVDAVRAGRRLSAVPPDTTLPAAQTRIAAAAVRLVEAAGEVAALPPVPDPPAAELIVRLLSEVGAVAAAATSDPGGLRVSALRSSLAVVDLVDRLLQPG